MNLWYYGHEIINTGICEKKIKKGNDLQNIIA